MLGSHASEVRVRSLFVLLISLFLALPAWAGVTLVATPPLVADGTTVANVRLYVDGGERPKVKSEDGKVGPVVASPDGVVTFPFTPERRTAAGSAVLQVTAGGQVTEVQVPVVPPFAGSLDLKFDPPVLSATGTAQVRVVPSQASAVAAEQRRFLLVASVGTVDAPVPAGDGTYVARYTPPKGLTSPTTVVFAAADSAAPDTVTGWATLPITVKKSVSFDAAAGSSNVLTVGSRTYGPLVASPAGKVAFDVELDPRTPTGRLVSVNPDTSRKETEVTMPGTPAAQVALLAVRPGTPAAGAAFPVRFVTLGPDGAPRNAATVKLSASAGTVTDPQGRDGLYEATFTPPATPAAVTFTVEADGAKATARTTVVPSMVSVTLTTDPAEIPAGATSFKAVARVKDSNGTSLPGRAPTFVVTGGTLSGTPKDNGDGSYTALVKVASSTTFARVVAIPPVQPTGLGPARLLVWPQSAAVAANGKDEVGVTVVAVDAAGVPVPNLEVRLGVPRGDGGLPPSVKTDARGVARAVYKAGTAAGLGALRAEAGGLVAEAPIFQVVSGMAPAVPVGGPPDVDALLPRLQAAVPETVAVRAGTAPLAGPPALVQLSTVPPYTTPGAAILVTVRVADSAGKGVAAQKLAVTAAPATVGTITDNRDGTYTFPVQLPAGVDGPLTLTVGAGPAAGGVTLPTLATAASMAPQAAARAPSGPTGSTASVPRAAPAAGEMARGRAAVLLTDAHGGFVQESNGGQRVLGKVDYQTPVTGFFGLHGEALYWVGQGGWGAMGAEARAGAQAELFSVLDEGAFSPALTAMVNARYRKSFGVGGIGGSLGGHYLSGMLFQYTDDSFAKVGLLTFPRIGARAGVQGYVETDRVYVELEAAETFVPFPVDTHVRGLFEYDLSGLGVRVGVAWDRRSMAFEADDGATTASIVQSQVIGSAGVGFEF